MLTFDLASPLTFRRQVDYKIDEGIWTKGPKSHSQYLLTKCCLMHQQTSAAAVGLLKWIFKHYCEQMLIILFVRKESNTEISLANV